MDKQVVNWSQPLGLPAKEFGARGDKPKRKTQDDEYVKDLDDPFRQSGAKRIHYTGIFLVSNSRYLGTVNSVQKAVPPLTIKFYFITVSGWMCEGYRYG